MAKAELTERMGVIVAWWDAVQPELSHNARVDLVSISMSLGGNILDLVHDAAFNDPSRSPADVLRTITEALSDTEGNGPMLRQLLRAHRSGDAPATRPYMTDGGIGGGPDHD